LQFDYAVDKARWEAGAKLDSLRIKDIMAGFEEQRKQQRREVMAAGVGALLAVAIVWIIRGTAE
jgi:predicted nucleic acid-binding Zn ribbon protein